MNLLEKIYSKIDKTIKFVFRLEDGLIAEASYIDKNDGKNIICVSTQTGCHLGCKFCFTTDCKNKIKVRNINPKEIIEQVAYVCTDLALKDKMLLVSYMGCGEPLMNVEGLICSMRAIKAAYQPCRFAVATLMPASQWHNMFQLMRAIFSNDLDVKIHLSLHFTDEKLRKEWMPAALPIKPSVAALEFYHRMGGKVEVHYTLIEGVNDTTEDANNLCDLLNGKDIPIKLLKYNERPTINNKSSENVQLFMKDLNWFWNKKSTTHSKVEYYEPVGVDVGSSCGAFLLDYYLKYNSIY